MAPVAGFVPDIVTNVFKSPFFRRGNKTPRKKTSSDNVSASPPEPQAGPSDAAVLQSSPRVAILESHVSSASVESIKEPPAVPPTSFASLDSLASGSSLKSRMSVTRMKLEPIIEQPTPSVTPNVSPPHEKAEPNFPTSSHQGSVNVSSSSTTIEKPQAHTVNNSPSSRTVTFLTTARASSMRTGVLFQPFGSPYVPSVDKMNPDGSADMSFSSEDEQSAVFATPPATPSMASESPTISSPPAVVLVSPSSERGLVLSPSDAFTQSPSPPRLPAPLRTASGNISDTRPSVSSRSSTGYSSDTGKSSSLPITPLDAPSNDGRLRSVSVWVGESAIEPIGVPLPTTYAEARSLANAFPEIAEEILKRPLGPSCPPSRATSPNRPAATPSPAPTSDAEDADDERSQIHFPTRRREHSPDHPNWALAPDEPQDTRERKRQRGRGRESSAISARGRGKHRNRRGRGRKSDTAASFERHHAAASVSESEVSPAQVIVETLLRGLKERVQSSPASSTVDADSASQRGHSPYPQLISDSEASVEDGRNAGEREAISRLTEAGKSRESASAAGSPQGAPRINVSDVELVGRTLQGQPKVYSSGSATSVPRRSPTQADSKAAATPVITEEAKETRPRNPRTATVEDVTDEDDSRASPVQSMLTTAILEMKEAREERAKVPKERETVEHDMKPTPASTAQRQDVQSAVRQETSKTMGAAEVPTAERVAPQSSLTQNTTAFSSHSQPSVPSWTQQEPGSSPNVRLPSPGKSTFSPFAPEFVPSGSRKVPQVPNVGVPDVFSSSTSQSGFATGPLPFAPFATNPDTAAIVNIASHAHSSAAELAKRASMTNLAAAADSNAPASASSAKNPTATSPPLFPPPVGNVTVAPPPSMTRPAVSGFAVTQTVNGSPAAGAFKPTQHAPHLGQSRRDSTASSNSATSAFGSPSPAPLHAGLLKRASVASLHQPIAPSPLSKTPIIGEMMQSPESRTMAFTPSPPIHAPTPLFGAHSKRPSVANLASAAATSPFAPGGMAGEPFTFNADGSPAAKSVDPRFAVNGQPGSGGSSVTVIPPVATTYRPTMDRGVFYETSQQPVPISRSSSPAYAWTPATRPAATANQGAPSVIGEPTRQHTAGGALAGYDAPPVMNPSASSPASRMLNTRRASFDLFANGPSPAHDIVAQMLEEERQSVETRERSVTAAISPAAPLATHALDVKLAMDMPFPPLPRVDVAQNDTGPSVRFAPIEPEVIRSTLSSGPTSSTQEKVPQELESAPGHPAQTFGSPEQAQGDSKCGETDNPTVPSIEVNLQGPKGPSVRPPTPGGQVTLTNLVAELCLQGTDTPSRPTSVVPDIHAGTSAQPAHWTIDEQGKLRAKKGENQPEPESLPNPQPQAPLPAAPPPPRRRLGREQPDAYKPYFQNAGPGNVAQANERFGGLRRRSMYFAREEGGIREESGERDASPGDARGGASVWRKGSGKWRKRVVDEEQEHTQEAITVPETSRKGRERERTREGWRLRRSPTPGVDEDVRA